MRQESVEKSVWKVGELAKRTGLSVRTLHHYDEIGLLSPSGRTETGHRLYSNEDVLRLQQIRSLKALGFSLEEVRACLEGASFSAERVIELHVFGLKEQIRLQQELLRRLERVMNSAGKPHRNANVSVSSVLRWPPVFRISKPFLSKFITRSRGSRRASTLGERGLARGVGKDSNGGD